jgi:hypothetical protein
MGSKKKSKTTKNTTTTVTTKVVKLSYVQTLAWSAQLGDIKDLETEDEKQDLGGEGGGKKSFLGWKGKKKSSSTKVHTGGEKIIDQWLQPYFDRIRYAVGVKEFTAARYTFKEASEFISTPFLSPKEIIKINLVTNENIPKSFDQNLVWFKYYIRPEGSEEWVRINSTNAPTRFDDQGLIVPKIINFNLPKPASASIEDKYQTTEEPVKQVRFRAVMHRPPGADFDTETPVLKSYRLLMTPLELL